MQIPTDIPTESGDKVIELMLPWAPSVNHYKKVGQVRMTKSGKLFQARVNSDETKSFYKEVWAIISQATARGAPKFLHSETIALEVWIILYPPSKSRIDIDNPVKAILDSLQRGGLIFDDNQISRLHVTRGSIVKHGKVYVRVAECT